MQRRSQTEIEFNPKGYDYSISSIPATYLYMWYAHIHFTADNKTTMIIFDRSLLEYVFVHAVECEAKYPVIHNKV